MALTAVTTVERPDRDQIGTIGRLKARRVTVTFTAGYDSTTGCSFSHAPLSGINEIVAIVPEGTANTGATVQVALANGDATLTLFNGTTKVVTSDQSATTAVLLVYGH